MKKFNFQLEKILNVRRFQQEQAELALGKALGEENAIQKKIEMIAAQHSAVVHQISATTDFSAIRAAQQYFQMLDVQKESLLNDLAQAKLITEQKRKILQEKMKKTSSLEKLREKEYNTYHSEAILEEEIITDDIVTSRFSRK